MELGAGLARASLAYVSWAEVNVTSDRRRREVRYYLKRTDGALDLAVVGKQKSSRLLSYRLAIRSPVLFSTSSFMRFKSRQEVADWLDSVVSNSLTHKSSVPAVEPLVSQKVNNLDACSFKLSKMGRFARAFTWLGSPWTCKKKRQHYQAFCRNGVRISVHDFVYVLAEANKHHVAYLEDMYEDSKGKKMVVIRWFHNIDEVGFILPHRFSDREILFSLCLQDLSIECIDGLAAVLSPQHYEQFLKTVIHTQLKPFVCQKQFIDDVVKPFDVTQVKGYWKQDIVIHLYPSRCHADYQQPALEHKLDKSLNDHNLNRPRKRLCKFKGADLFLAEADRKVLSDAVVADVPKFERNSDYCKNGVELCNSINGRSSSSYMRVGSKVEVLSQDSGIRGCWFRAVIIKKHKDKVKVQYQDIQDAADDLKKLEEWISAFKSANPDPYGIRLYGRKIVRPSRDIREEVPCIYNVGSIVDVWRHDGWWEGIVMKKDSEGKFHIYFSGERFESVFRSGDVRESQEWVGNEWKHVAERPDFLESTLTSLSRQEVDQSCNLNIVKEGTCSIGCDLRDPDLGNKQPKESGQLRDLAKDNLLSQLKWSSSKKRNSGKQLLHSNDRIDNRKVMESVARKRFPIPKTLKVDRENCKHIGESFFGSSIVTNLVMTN